MRRLLLLICLLVATAVTAGDIVVLGLFKDKAVLTIDGNRRVLKRGERSPEGVRLVSADSEAAVLEIAGQTRRHLLGSHIGASYAAPAVREVRLWADSAGMFHTNGSINGYTVQFLVDTGATSVAMSAVEARRLGIDYRMSGRETTATTASGVARAWGIRLDAVRVGDILLRNVEATVLDGGFPRDVLLGMTFLGQLEMAREGSVLQLRQKQ